MDRLPQVGERGENRPPIYRVGEERRRIPLTRFLYAWFVGPIPEGYVIVHADGNALNNGVSNLLIMESGEWRESRRD